MTVPKVFYATHSADNTGIKNIGMSMLLDIPWSQGCTEPRTRSFETMVPKRRGVRIESTSRLYSVRCRICTGFFSRIPQFSNGTRIRLSGIVGFKRYG